MLMTVKTRQQYLRYLGYYTGAIDGKVGPLTKEAYKKLQNDYFFNKKDKDGKYGKWTDILLYDAYWTKMLTKNFDLKTELRCGCKGKYCTGYPVKFNHNMLIYLQDFRDEYGPTEVESFCRCKKHNNSLKGSSKTSLHMDARAADVYADKACSTEAKRKQTIDKYITKAKAHYAYCNGYGRYKKKTTKPKAPNMGKSIHIDVNK